MPRILEGKELKKAIQRMHEAVKHRSKATCLRAKCLAIIYSEMGRVIGIGYNAPPGGERSRKCHIVSSLTPNPRHDQTCCVHAEWEAGIDALSRGTNGLPGSTMYFTRVDDAGNIIRSGKPYCTICSRFVLRLKIAKFVLWHEEGMTEYDTVEYNDLSYAFKNGP